MKSVMLQDADLKKEKYKIVSEDEMMEIILSRKPIGRFVTYEGDRVVGCDNLTGDAWTEDFDTLEACEKWLLNEK